MTYKEIVLEYAPQHIDERCVGGVRGCPHDYPFILELDEFATINRLCAPTGQYCESLCKRCWDREASIVNIEKEELFDILKSQI